MSRLFSKSNRYVRIGGPIMLSVVLLAACTSGEDAPARTTGEQAGGGVSGSAFNGKAADELISDELAMRYAEELYGTHCASCHGRDGEGRRGAMSLTNGVFTHGATEEAIRATIRDGRQGVMPAMGRRIGEVDIGHLVRHVRSLSGESRADDGPGQALFEEHCAACHGADGRGLPEIGAPDLTDGYWQHGETMMNIRLVITRGIESQCPAHAESLGPTGVELLTALVLKLSDTSAPVESAPAATATY